jgi:polysaccharide pyruvyl transferase WcaK-like protein
MGYFGHANVGDEAMLLCWVNALRDLGALDRAIAFTAEPEAVAAAHGIKAVHNIIPTSFYRYFVGFAGRNRKNFIRSLSAFRSCKLLIVGGGSLFHDRPDTSEYLLDLLRRIELAKNRRQTVLLLGVGVGPIHRDESKAALRRVLSRVDAIAVRDSTSRALLDELQVSGPEVHTAADPTFLLDPPPSLRLEELTRREQISDCRTPKVGICVRSFDLRREPFRAAILDLCGHLLRDLHASIWLFPMQTGGGEDDRVGAQQLVDELGQDQPVHIVSATYGPVDTIGLLSCMHIVVGEKFHSIIFSALTCTPFLAISYAPKIRSFARDIGHDEWCIDLAEVDSARLWDGFRSIWDRRDQIHENLQVMVESLREQSGTNLTILKHYLA